MDQYGQYSVNGIYMSVACYSN